MTKIIIALLMICACAPHALAQCTLKSAQPRFKRSVYDFSVELLARLAQENESHFVTSTLSAWTLLTATSLGAADPTIGEMSQVLGLHKQKCYNYKYLELANSIASNNETDVVVKKSSAMFVDDETPILDTFKAKLTKAARTVAENLAFKDAEAAAQRINGFVGEATDDVIDEIVSSTDLDDVALIMIDAVYFKGMWKTPFPYENTQVEAFYNEKGDQIGTTNSMFLSASFNFRDVPKLDAIVLELPYGSGTRYSMLVFLPHMDVSVYTVIEKLRLISLRTIEYLFNEIGETKAGIYLPKFTITSDLNNLKELLEDMGLKTMFDSRKANFSNLSNNPLYVSNFIQKASIEVTEEGTVAAAVTEEELSFRSRPYQLNINRPFLYMIVDKQLEVPIFAGAYSKPSEQ